MVNVVSTVMLAANLAFSGCSQLTAINKTGLLTQSKYFKIHVLC